MNRTEPIQQNQKNLADVERESNNSDQIQLTNTPEKDSENRGCKKVCEINSKKRKRKRSSTSASFRSSSSLSSSNSDERRENKKKTTQEKDAELSHTR